MIEKTPWISAKTPPEEDGVYLVINYPKSKDYPDVTSFSKDLGWYSKFGDITLGHEISHWMKIPKFVPSEEYLNSLKDYELAELSIQDTEGTE